MSMAGPHEETRLGWLLPGGDFVCTPSVLAWGIAWLFLFPSWGRGGMKHALVAPELPFGAARGGKGLDPAFLLSGAQGGTRQAVRGAESLISNQTGRTSTQLPLT